MSRLESLRISWSPRDEACLEHLAPLRLLRTLSLGETQVGDAGMQRLAGLEQLEYLDIDGRLVTDEGLAAARHWSRLRVLSLLSQSRSFPDHRNDPQSRQHPPRLTDRGLMHLAHCPDLRQVRLIGANFSDEGFRTLARLPKLERRSLDGCRATAAGFASLLAGHQFDQLELLEPGVTDDVAPLLAGQNDLSMLAIRNESISGRFLLGLAGLPRLFSIDLCATGIDDAALARSAATLLPIGSLHLLGTSVTATGVAAFKATHPRCSMSVGPYGNSY